METSNVNAKERLRKLLELKSLIDRGIQMGLDLSEILDKVENVVRSCEDNIIRIVLLGTFSDGKTSVVAGLLGKLEDSMKIDLDESSDELTIYRPQGLKEGFEIVDTPGLFGTKEKEVEGKSVKYSELTEKYISEAHIIIYVCEAVTPLKDSHKDIIKLVMRQFGKLASTLFVINKMDEAGTDMLDEEDYAEMSSIKKNYLLKRLRDTIELTPEEERDVKIACVAADPKGKGLKYWFENMDKYLRRSHITLVRDFLSSLTETLNMDSVMDSTEMAVIKDVIRNVVKQIELADSTLSSALFESREVLKDMENDLNMLKRELTHSKSIMKDRLGDLKKSVKANINNATLETMSNVVDDDLGVEGESVTGYVLLSKIKQILSECAEANLTVLSIKEIEFSQKFDKQDSLFGDAFKKGGRFLGNLNINGEMIKTARDIFAKSYKFKPWGAISLSKNLTKWAGRTAIAVTLVVELWGIYSEWSKSKELSKIKTKLNEEIDTLFSQIFQMFDNDEEYYKNFAPSYIEMSERVQERRKEIDNVEHHVVNLKNYKDSLKHWLKMDAEDFDTSFHA